MLDEYAADVLLELKRSGASRFGRLAPTIRNPKTLSRKLKMLASMGLVNHSGGLYTLTAEGERATEIVRQWRQLSQSATSGVKNTARIPHPTFGPVLGRYCRILKDHFGPRLLGVVLFGSVARGDWSEDSDIDLLLVVDRWEVKSWARSKELLGLRKMLRKTKEYVESVRSGYVPTIQHYPLSAKEASLEHRIYPDLVLDGIVVYEEQESMTRLIQELRERLRKRGARRITTATGESHWEMAPIEMAEETL